LAIPGADGSISDLSWGIDDIAGTALMPEGLAQLGDAFLASQSCENNPDPLFGAVNLSGLAADVLDGLLGLGFRGHALLAHLRSLGATLSQNPSFTQSP